MALAIALPHYENTNPLIEGCFRGRNAKSPQPWKCWHRGQSYKKCISQIKRLPTPPPSQGPLSPRKRRRLLRESEDAEGEMDIEDCIYRTDSFRSISFSNPDPMALKVNLTTAQEDPTKDIHRDIFDMLDLGSTIFQQSHIGMWSVDVL